VSSLFRKELGDVLWDRIHLHVNVVESGIDDFVTLEYFLADRPAVTASIKVLKIYFMGYQEGDRAVKITSLLETASITLQLECLEIDFTITPEEIAKLAAGQGERKILELVREIRVSKEFVLYILPACIPDADYNRILRFLKLDELSDDLEYEAIEEALVKEWYRKYMEKIADFI